MILVKAVISMMKATKFIMNLSVLGIALLLMMLVYITILLDDDIAELLVEADD
jgi:hypothetical protein